MTALPKNILTFFNDTTRDISTAWKPDWLRSELEEAVWVVALDDDLREVTGQVKGGVRLRWDIRLPDGLLIERQFTLAHQHAKHLLIVEHAWKNRRSIETTHRVLILLIEYLAVRRPADLQQLGLAAVTVDDVEEFAAAFEESGFCGTAAYIERWSTFLEKRCGTSSPGPTVTAYLLAANAFRASGRIDTRYVAQAIGTDQRRAYVSRVFGRHLSRYGMDAQGMGESDQSSQGPVTGQTLRALIQISKAASRIPNFKTWDLADTATISANISAYINVSTGRTRTMPMRVGRQLVEGCMRWLLDVAPHAEAHLEHVSRVVTSQGGGRHAPIKSIQKAEEVCAPGITEVAIPRLWKTLPDSHAATRIHTAVCFAVTALFACCRRTEVLELDPTSVIDSGDRPYLDVTVAKTRARMRKPIPKALAQALSSLNRFKLLWNAAMPSDDPLLARRIFFRISNRGLSPIANESIYVYLRELSEYLDLMDEQGNRFVVRPHQLRRYFAMTFFHAYSGENSLPALSWFMGHDSVQETWRYIKEELTGSELTDVEASMAMAAVYSDDQSAAVGVCRILCNRGLGYR
ncbi:hypothetical protein [Dyella sp. 2YAF14]|uniref:hypothetical protein n=1 Tax=Dyella sp. 2YAF14 TaxID=3233025 RepID=UPI003F901A38